MGSEAPEGSSLREGIALALLVSCVSLTMVVGCGDSPSGGAIDDEDYFPHTLGSWWQYEKSGELDTLGMTFEIHGERLTTVTAVLEQEQGTLLQMTNVGFDTLMLAGVDSIFVPLAPMTLARIRDDGIWLYGDSTMQDSTWWVRFPLEPGSSWTSHVDPEMVSEVISMTEQIEVPDGTFENVLHVRATYVEVAAQVVWDYYFAPNVGNILGETTGTVGGATTYSSTEWLTGHMTL